MQLEKATIRNYKCLRDVTVDFSRPEDEEAGFSEHLLVGVNGSGKSCFLEALGLIFTRIMQGEVPGFPFSVQYRIGKDQNRVRIEPSPWKANAPGRLYLTVNDGRRRIVEEIPEEYLPRRIVACSSGANHQMDSVLLT